jgi:phage terminase large subunit
MILDIPTARVFVPLLKPARYKGAHGGRGSGKSHFFGGSLIERAVCQRGLRAVCIREVQKSLDESVKRLLEDKIAAMGVGSMFKPQESKIRTPGGGQIIFQGMQDHTAESIKSLEGYDIAWVEEAQALSKRSLQLLRPTIRKPGSELWFSWNPESQEDPVDVLLRGPHCPEDAIVVEANWRDNPWFTAELEEERARDQVAEDDDYGHVWEGEYLTISEARIFRKRVTIEEFAPPQEGTRLFFGADWGFSIDPTALVRSWIKDDILHVDHEAFGTHVEIDETAALFDTVPGSRAWPIKADSARPETISYMMRQGFNIAAAEKWQGSVEDGIAHLKGFKQIKVHPRCVNIAREFRLYSYKVDKKTGDVLPIIVDKFNHGIDALRYSLDGYIQRRGGTGVWAKLAGR